MTTSMKSIFRIPRKPLAACCAAMFALAAPEAFAANTWTVTTCADHGSGSLRDIVTNSAVSGDTVDLSKLKTNYGCTSSTISLTTGAITIGQTNLFLEGPTDRITITGYYNGAYENDRIFNHTGTGTLNLGNLNIEYNRFSPATGNALGGCIYSDGSVSLDNVTVFQCHATANATGANTLGGGVYTKGSLSMKYSRITANSAASNATPFGGGAFVNGGFSADHSSIESNSAPHGFSGGVHVTTNSAFNVTISNSTISGNTANFAGGVYLSAPNSVTITNSTISGNHSDGGVGGLAIEYSHSTTIQNSTIAFNTAVSASPADSPGVYIRGFSGSASSVILQSSILSNNTYGTTENDFGAYAKSGGTFNVTSNNNIIRSSPGTVRPATVTTACPLLGPLRDNGGPGGGHTLTHALMSHSPAIDAGNNNANLNEDQRGGVFDTTPYPYPRASGVAPDIGAYEVQQTDIIFNAGFEGCPVLF